jgi:hypothetical protein
MISPTGTFFEFSSKDFEEALLRLENIEFKPADGVFVVDMLLILGLFGQYLVDRAPKILIKEALDFTLNERGLPLELASNASFASDCNALRITFYATIESRDGDELVPKKDLIEGTDYQVLSPRCIEIGATGIIKIGTDPDLIAEEALSLLPQRYHWIAKEDHYQKFLKCTEAGCFLNLEDIDYENVIQEGHEDDDPLNPMAYLFLMSKLRLWQ